MTEQIYRADAYARETKAKVVAITERGGIVLDRTTFYASAGGQPGDKGSLRFAGGAGAATVECGIATTVYDADKTTIVHVPAEGASKPAAGDMVTAVLDWETRHRLMRVHTALHLLCSLVPFPVTGGQIAADGGRLDFDIPDMSAVDKDKIAADLNRLISENHPVSDRWITDAEMDARPELVRTMSVKPPSGTGRVRLVAIGVDGAIDLQPCGGTHVRATAEIGPVTLGKFESKGKQNRRIRVMLAG
jgi:misacylated tRNA(Ala) deacylase